MTLLDPVVLFNRLLSRGRLRHLHLLVALADAGSVQRAASQVGMSQPAATQALSDLEQLLGMGLFERHARGVRATRSGQAMVTVARSVLQALNASTEMLVALEAGASDLLRLGCIPAASSGLLRQSLPMLLQAHPGLQVELVEENSAHLLPELAAGRLDAVLCRGPQGLAAHWRFELMLPDTPVVIAHPKHPLALGSTLAISALKQALWILPPRGMGVRDFYDQLWAEESVAPPLYPLVTTALPVILDVMRTARALSLVPRSLAVSLVEWGLVKILPVTLPELPAAALEGLGVVTRNTPPSKALNALRALLSAGRMDLSNTPQ